MSHKSIINFSGSLVSLGPLVRELCSFYQKWNNDFQTTQTLAVSRPVTLDEQIASFERFSKADSNHIFFTIYAKENDRPIGFTYLADIDHRNRTAEFGIVIGEGDCRGKGFGTETTQLVLSYAFSVLGLHNVVLKVYEFNKSAIRAYEKAGFVKCGYRRQAHFMLGRLWDVIFMECLATEFNNSILNNNLLFKTSY